MSTAHDNPNCKIPLGGGPGGVKRVWIAITAAVACIAMAVLLANHRTPGYGLALLTSTGPLVISGVRGTLEPKCLTPVLADKKDPAAIAEEADHLAIFAILLSVVLLIGTSLAWDSSDPLAMQTIAILGPMGFAGVCFAMGQFSKAAAVRYRAQRDIDTMLAHTPGEVPPSTESDGAAQIDQGGESR